jgi:hypothetical protein
MWLTTSQRAAIMEHVGRVNPSPRQISNVRSQKLGPQQNATPAQLEDMSETEVPPEVVDLIGGPTRIRTWNQQIMSLLL